MARALRAALASASVSCCYATAGCFAAAEYELVAAGSGCVPRTVPRPCASVPRLRLWDAASADPTNQCVVNNATHCVAMKGGSSFVTDLARNWTRKAAPDLWFEDRPLKRDNGCWSSQARAAAATAAGGPTVLVFRNPFVKFMSAVIHKGLKVAGKAATTTHMDPDDVDAVRSIAHVMVKRRIGGFIANSNPHFLPLTTRCGVAEHDYAVVVELSCLAEWETSLSRDPSARAGARVGAAHFAGRSYTAALTARDEFDFYCRYYDADLAAAVREWYAADFAATATPTAFACGGAAATPAPSGRPNASVAAPPAEAVLLARPTVDVLAVLALASGRPTVDAADLERLIRAARATPGRD
jgi:hypothetical protein